MAPSEWFLAIDKNADLKGKILASHRKVCYRERIPSEGMVCPVLWWYDLVTLTSFRFLFR